jgi:Zn-dependent protease with chaperone function
MTTTTQPTVAQPTVKQLRHRAEIPMLALGIVLTLAVGASVIALMGSGIDTEPWGTAALGGLLAPAMLFFLIRYVFWNAASNGVPVTANQFPELHQVYQELALTMGFTPGADGITRTPQLFVTNGNGELNASAAKCRIRRGYVMLHSDLLDVAYTHGDWATVRAVLAHELGHIKCGHVNLWRAMVAPIMTLLFLDKSLTRAQEYTADRVASYYTGTDALGMIVLFAGKNVYQRVHLDDYLAYATSMGQPIWLRLANFLSDHAVGFRRMTALGRTRTEGWNVHGKML